MSPRLVVYALLLLGGTLWGLTIPVTKIVVSTGHQPFGLIFWQLAISVLILVPVILLRGRSLRIPRQSWGLCLMVGLLGTVLPNSFSYQAAVHLPGGILAIVISLVPMFALPMAVALGRERLEARRFAGILAGALAVILLVAPETSLPAPGQAFWVLVAMISPLCYGAEGNYVAIRGTDALDAMQLLFGASMAALVITVPLVWSSGQYVDLLVPWGAPEWGILLNTSLHVVAYSIYLWLVGQAGAVFTSQISYLVTGSGVLWSMTLLSESYAGWVWAALGLMLAGLALVQPKPAAA